MPHSSTPPIAVVHTWLIQLGAVSIAGGVLGATGDNEVRWIFWVFVLLAVCGVLVLLAGVRGLFAWGRAAQADERARVAAAQPGATAERELGLATLQALGMGAIVFLVYTLAMGVMDGSWRMAATLAGALGTTIALTRWLVAFAVWRGQRAVPAGAPPA